MRQLVRFRLLTRMVLHAKPCVFISQTPRFLTVNGLFMIAKLAFSAEICNNKQGFCAGSRRKRGLKREEEEAK